ncbi:hypothetical protein V7S43_012925 [Phytophthora oleae]|uniref:Uncharacterized protein n=1 Tax=Phytophthora oleae TaxID=2107226 RepID=A0ABD3F9C9_9STRA
MSLSHYANAEVSGCRAWLDADLAALPRTDGGLAIPDLKTELLAMAAATVAKWALHGTHEDHIVGDILLAEEECLIPPAAFITPNGPTSEACRSRWEASMWLAGSATLRRVGLPPEAGQKLHMVSALYILAEHFGGLQFTWAGHQMEVNGVKMLGSVQRLFQETDQTNSGAICTEWLPYVHIRDFRLYDGSVDRFTTSDDFYQLVRLGHRLPDVLHWRRHGAGRVTVTALCKASLCTQAVKRQLCRLLTVLITNIPILLTQGF